MSRSSDLEIFQLPSSRMNSVRREMWGATTGIHGAFSLVAKNELTLGSTSCHGALLALLAHSAITAQCRIVGVSAELSI